MFSSSYWESRPISFMSRNVLSESLWPSKLLSPGNAWVIEGLYAFCEQQGFYASPLKFCKYKFCNFVNPGEILSKFFKSLMRLPWRSTLSREAQPFIESIVVSLLKLRSRTFRFIKFSIPESIVNLFLLKSRTIKFKHSFKLPIPP